MAERRVTTRLGIIACPRWCREDHANVDETSVALWHEGVPLGPCVLVADDGEELSVSLRQFVDLDGDLVKDDPVGPVVISFWFDDGSRREHLLPAEALNFAAALLAGAAAAVAARDDG